MVFVYLLSKSRSFILSSQGMTAIRSDVMKVTIIRRTIAVTGKNDLVIGALKIHIYRCFKQAVESLPSHAIYNE